MCRMSFWRSSEAPFKMKDHKKSLAEFFARRQKTVLIVFSGGVYVGENTESDGKRIRAGFFRANLRPYSVIALDNPGKDCLRSMPRPDKNPLRKNCLAHFSEKCQRYFVCGGRRLADASQRRQARKSLTVPMKCGVYPFPVRPSRSECRIVRLRRTTEAQSAVQPIFVKEACFFDSLKSSFPAFREGVFCGFVKYFQRLLTLRA